MGNRARFYTMAPVKPTCLIIDEVQGAIEEATEFLAGLEFDNEGEQEESYDLRRKLLSAQKDTLEAIRSANDKLRDWGARLEEELEEAQERIAELERELECAA